MGWWGRRWPPLKMSYQLNAGVILTSIEMYEYTVQLLKLSIVVSE